MTARRSILIVASLVLSLVAAQPAGAALASRRFETPSGNISCHLPKGGALRCDIYSGLNPEPEKECELDWTGLLLSRRHTARPNCAGDTVPQTNRVLEYGAKWKRGGRVCVSKRTGLHCWNEAGYHFKLARDGWRRWHEG
jgi:hypothetical protein